MAKKIITESVDTEFNAKTGKYEVNRKRQVAVLKTEDKYYKFYHRGLIYISDMPHAYLRVFYALLENMSYVDDKVEGLDDFGMQIFVNVEIKRAIAQKLGFENYRSVDNIIQNLVKGDVLIRIAKGIYRPNPYIVARGAWAEIIHLRNKCAYPFADGDTFKTVCARKDAAKKQIKEATDEQKKHKSEQDSLPKEAAS